MNENAFSMVLFKPWDNRIYQHNELHPSPSWYPNLLNPTNFRLGRSCRFSAPSVLPTRKFSNTSFHTRRLWNVHHCQLQSWPPKPWMIAAPPGCLEM